MRHLKQNTGFVRQDDHQGADQCLFDRRGADFPRGVCIVIVAKVARALGYCRFL